MAFNKTHLFFYIMWTITQAHNIISSHTSLPSSSIEKNKTKILQLVCENQQIATECQTIFETIIQNLQKIEQYEKSAAIFNQASIDVEALLEVEKSFNIHEMSEQQLSEKYQELSNSLTEIQKSVQSILPFIQNDIQTYNDTIAFIKAKIKAVEENTPLKKSKYLQFFNATKQLESAIESCNKTTHDFDNWLAATTESTLLQNSALKHIYATDIHEAKNKISTLESYKKPEIPLLCNLEICEQFLRKIKQRIDTISQQKQRSSKQQTASVIEQKQTIELITDSTKKQIVQEDQPIYTTSNNHDQPSQKNSLSQPKEQQIALKRVKKQQQLQEKIKQKEEKKQQKAQERLNKKQQKLNALEKKANKLQLEPAVINNIDQHEDIGQKANLKKIQNQSEKQLLQRDKQCENQSLFETKPVVQKTALTQNDFFEDTSCKDTSCKDTSFQDESSIEERFIKAEKDNNVMQIIEKVRNETLYALQDLQYYEEKNHISMAHFHDQQTVAQKEIHNFLHQINLFKNRLNETVLDREKQEDLYEICNRQQQHANNIEQANERIEQLLVHVQHFKEQRVITQEQFFKQILLVLNNALKEFKDLPEEQFKTTIKELELEHQQKTIFYKKELAVQKNAILQQQTEIQNQLQLLKELEASIETTVYETELSQEKYKMLLPVQMEETRQLEQTIRAQQAVEQNIDTLFSIIL